jgi:hypothetical protein
MYQIDNKIPLAIEVSFLVTQEKTTDLIVIKTTEKRGSRP